MLPRRAGGILLAACLGISGAGCGLLLGVSSWQDVSCADNCGADGSADGPVGNDSTTDSSDGGQGDSNLSDTSPGADAPADALDSGPEPDAADPYHPINQSSYWATFDVSTLDGGARGFLGGTFDGRYVYLAPHGLAGAPSGVVTRLDTQADGGFGTRASWQTFDTSTIDGGAGASGYQGAVYDNVHERVYLVPDNDGVADGIVAVYPTGSAGDAGVLPFSNASSWSTYAPVVGDAGALAGFAGGTFDGQYLYLVPSNNGAPDGIAARLDTNQPFASPSSWSSFDMTKIPGPGARAVSYLGAVYTGSLVLFAPTAYPQGAGTVPSGWVVDYAPSAQPFATGTWQPFEVNVIPTGGNAGGFRGVAFDGRYAYFVPNSSGTLHAVVARYDSTGQFTDNGSWSFFDAQQLPAAGATGFFGGAFDGRYIYLIPNANTLLVRYDTTIAGPNAFTTASSWSTYDMTSLVAGKGPFAGAVFDGEFLYFVPQNSGVVTRFDARSPPMQVPMQTGSFF